MQKLLPNFHRIKTGLSKPKSLFPSLFKRKSSRAPEILKTLLLSVSLFVVYQYANPKLPTTPSEESGIRLLHPTVTVQSEESKQPVLGAIDSQESQEASESSSLQPIESEGVLDTNDQLRQVFTQPLKVYIDKKGDTEIYEISERELLSITKVDISKNGDNVWFGIDTNSLINLIEIDQQFNLRTDDGKEVLESYVEKLHQTLNDRYTGKQVDSIRLTTNGQPGTKGGISAKYIEIDISQQKLYLFQDGKMQKSYQISTGKEYPTPTGQFKILNKAPLAYSEIYEVWMPYWLGFAYSSELGASFGIHELPYSLVENKIIRRLREFIGSPSTGGCIALAPGDAQEVYEFARGDMPLVIHQ